VSEDRTYKITSFFSPLQGLPSIFLHYPETAVGRELNTICILLSDGRGMTEGRSVLQKTSSAFSIQDNRTFVLQTAQHMLAFLAVLLSRSPKKDRRNPMTSLNPHRVKALSLGLPL